MARLVCDMPDAELERRLRDAWRTEMPTALALRAMDMKKAGREYGRCDPDRPPNGGAS
jgi:hypothetical protein